MNDEVTPVASMARAQLAADPGPFARRMLAVALALFGVLFPPAGSAGERVDHTGAHTASPCAGTSPTWPRRTPRP
jgi:hypothetical protein